MDHVKLSAMVPRWIAPFAAALALGGCYRPAPAPAAASAPAGAAVDADPGWPTTLELELTQRSDVLKHNGLAMFSVELALPVFRSDPPAIAAALNARLARFARPDVDPRTHEGSYTLECGLALANRYAVIFDCSQLLDERTHDEAALGIGGAPGEPTRLVFGWWLRRGLPELSLEQFAPQLDLRAAVDAAARSPPAGCDLRACAFDPRSFVFDGDGLTLVATEACATACEASIPTIPLDHLAPTHAWAAELVKRVRRRARAGDALVEGDRSD